MSATQLAEANVKQLRIEAELPRIKVSEAAKDLQVSCNTKETVNHLYCNLITNR